MEFISEYNILIEVCYSMVLVDLTILYASPLIWTRYLGNSSLDKLLCAVASIPEVPFEGTYVYAEAEFIDLDLVMLLAPCVDLRIEDFLELGLRELPFPS
jgi:hypothetical protein